MELKIGDYVLVRKPKNTKEYPTWISEMDKYNGKIMKIKKMKDIKDNMVGIK